MYVILLIFFVLCLACTKLRFSKNKETEPPELSRWIPFIGHGLRFIRRDVYASIVDASEECLNKGGVVKSSLLMKKNYLITDPEAFLAISNTCAEKHDIYKIAKPIFGDGLPTADALTWKCHRKLLNPAFSIPVIKDFIKIFNDRAKILVELFALHLDTPYNYKSLIKAWSLETICYTTTGMQCDENNDLRDKYLYLEDKLQNCLNERIRKIWLHNDFLYRVSNLKKETDKFATEFKDFSNAIIQQKKHEIKDREQERGTHKLFLERILDIKNEQGFYTDKQLQEEVDTIILAGFDTTATTLNIIFIILGSYPNVQQRVYNEILQVLEKTDFNLEKDDLSKFVYTEAVIKETMRLYPLLPFVGRYINKDIKLKNYTLRKNTSCILSIYGLNRNSNWGPDADQFRPERWLDAATLPDHNNFGTFSIGKRNCIGKAYAMDFMKTVVVHVIGRYQISADISKVVFKWALVIYPVSGHHFTLKKREIINS